MLQTPKRLLLGAAGCAAAFVLLLLLVYAPDFGRWADAAALQGFLGLQRPAITGPSDAIAHLGDPRSFILIGLALVFVALARGLPRHALAAVAILAGSNLATQILKPLLATPRDAGEVTGLHIVGPAFPSGHATASMSLAIVAVLVVPRAWRPVVAAIGALFAIAVSFAIVSLGWHYPSDVVGGYLVATGWSLVVMAGLRAAEARWPQRTGREAAAAAARRASERTPSIGPPPAIAALIVLPVVAVVGVVALLKLPALIDYADRHTAFAVAVPAIALAAVALLAGVTLASGRR